MAEKILNYLSKIEAPAGLSEKVRARIDIAGNRTLKVKFFLTWIMAGLSAVALVPACLSLLQSLAQSGFYDYFSIIFSDGDAFLNIWSDLLLSLVEALPVLGLAICLALILIILYSVKLISKNNIHEPQRIFRF